MANLDPNKLAALVALIVLAALPISSGYRIEIGTAGFKFEHGTTPSDAKIR